MSRTITDSHLEQLKIAFPDGGECPFCGKWIDPDNPPVRLLVAMATSELFCSADHFDKHQFNNSSEETKNV